MHAKRDFDIRFFPQLANALTAETTEALSTTETEEPELDEVEKAHQLLLCRYDFVEDNADNFYKTTGLDLDGLWDFDNICVKVAAKNGRIDSGKLYLASKSGAWDDVLLRELSLRGGQDTVNMGFIRDTFSGDLISTATVFLLPSPSTGTA